MYCLEKLQRELAYFFDMDLRELPKVESLLAEAGYTQIRKGDDIIEIDLALGRYSADLGDSSVETKELHTKTTSKLTKDELDNLPIATAQEYGEFLEKIAQKDYQNTPEILKIATLNSDLQELINNNHSASVFITRARAGHISEVRKGEYDQALTLEEQKQIPAEIAQAKQAYTDDKSGFILPFADKNNNEKINLIILDSDSKGNFLITAKKVNGAELNNPKYKKLARAGVEPATTTPPKAEQKPTEAISLARDEIIPQSTQEKPKWSRSDSKKWKLDKLEQTKAAARRLYEQLQPIYEQARPLLIKAQELKSKSKAQELKDKAWKLIEQESKPFIKELEQHALELDRTAFTLYPESASIKIQPKRNFDLEWKNKTRASKGLKGAAKYRAQALQRLSEKDYMTPFEQATKASNPLTSLHALKFEILKDLHKAKVYINQQDYDKDLHKTYLGYVNRTSSELDSIDQSIRELKSKIQPKPQRVQEVRSKVQDLIKWRDEVRFDTDYLLALKSDGVRHALEYLEDKLQAATLPQQASFINQLKEQIKEHFPTPPTPPTQKGLFDEVETKQIQNSHNLHILRENAKTTLAPLINKEITNINTQEVATLTNKGIRKMTSDKAVAKSVANGFSEAEHFKAVEQVTKLFEKATKATSYTDPTDTNLTIHRYNAPFENANALLTLKEYMQDGKRMYSLELENLDAIKFNPSGKDLMEQSPKSKDIDTANFNAPSENPSDTIPKLPFEMQVLAEDKLSGDEVRHLANKIGEKSTMAYFKDYLLKMDRDFHTRAKDIIREYYKIEPFRKELENQWENVKEAYKNGEISLKEFKFLSKYKDEKSFLNQVAGVLWQHNNELVKNRGYTINKYEQIEEGKGNNYYQNLALEYDGALKNIKKWFYYIQKANKQAQRFFNKKEAGGTGGQFWELHRQG